MITRWLESLLREGRAPDPRFTLANERTFLAWIRTSIGVLAAGIAVDAFVAGLPPGLRKTISALLVVLGGGLAVSAFLRWLALERALRRGEPLPPAPLVPVFAVALGLTAALLLVVVAVRP